MIAVWLSIIITVTSVVGVLGMILLALATRDRRMEKAQRAFNEARMCRAEKGHMDALDRALWIRELHTYAKKHPEAWREANDK